MKLFFSPGINYLEDQYGINDKPNPISFWAMEKISAHKLGKAAKQNYPAPDQVE
jgi:hypothetical protein